jgi:uncharacterized protein DUF1236
MRTFLVSVAAAAAVTLGASGAALAQRYDAPRSLEFGTTSAGEKFALTDEQRVILRRYVHPRVQSGVTTGSASRIVVAAGDRIPDSVALRPFPAPVYHEAPRLAPYRYIQVGGRAFVVDPRDRTVIEEID